MILQWDEKNITHIGEHGVSPNEARYVLTHMRPPYPRAIEDQKHLVWGRTDEGRYLQVIFTYLEDDEVDFAQMALVDRMAFIDGEEKVAYVVHSRSLTFSEKQVLRKLRRGT